MTSLLNLATTIATDAATFIREQRAKGVNVAASKSSLTDIVTETDQASERMVAEAIMQARPNDSLLGEEGLSHQGSSGLTWIIDPIDGTVNYFYDIPTYAVSIAVVEGDADPQSWTSLAGAVVNAPLGDVFAAARGEGATLNGRSIAPTGETRLEQSLLGTGFSYEPERRARQGVVVAQILPRARDLRRIGSAALDICFVASGQFDGYWERGLKPWDFAAAMHIAEEAGVEVRGLRGDRADGRLLMAGSAGLLDTLEPLLLEFKADEA
ncbi:inositol monophosphatase family protein [Humidisolicoccus flavus]|uniref:inositol monophosphatase family protein n=1 Tax=Humidisolicoccus flavus TaxID=3111414 RepID=UPI003253AC89